jgi:hypothetical protein
MEPAMNIMKRFLSVCAAGCVAGLSPASAQFRPLVTQPANLVPNGDFSKGLEGWRYEYAWSKNYGKNHNYIKLVPGRGPKGMACVLLDLPAGVPGNEGGMIDTAWMKAEPGASYKVQVDCMTWDLSARLWVDAYTHDPDPAHRTHTSIKQIPAYKGMPALVCVYRAQIPQPPGKSKTWTTVEREFELPLTFTVGGEEQKPEYLCIRAYSYAGTPGPGKSYFANFRLYKIK